MKSKIYDCLIVGGGVVGASVFNKLVRLGKSCLLLDKASDVATGASKANSGLVHAGYDPKPNTLKAKLNVRGSKLYPSICKRLGVKLKKCGALVVGDDAEKIQKLYERGLENKVRVEVWDRAKIQEKVPDIAEHISVALFAPDASLVSPYLFTISLVDEAILNGGEVSLEEDILSCTKKNGIFEIKTQKGLYFAKNVVNSAGCGYNEVAKLFGSEEYEIELRRGEYFVFDKACGLNVPCTVFPLPTALGKGVLVTPTVDGNFLIGPTSVEADEETCITRDGLATIKKNASNMIKNINFRHAIREFSGIRTICGEDFVIEKSKKVDGMINLAGICSPGLSSAPAIAEMVAELLGFDLKEKENLVKLPKYEMFCEMSTKKQKELCKTDENYRQIVCKCEKVTKGDVLQALDRPLKVHSVDGIKRRTNAGMGRCQGGFCFTKVVNEIAKARGLKYEEVLKENRGSEVAIGTIREVEHD